MFHEALLLIALSFALVTCHIKNYCEEELCDLTPYEHITCEATGTLLPDCPSDARVVPLTKKDIHLIVDLHNSARNNLASGNEGFNPAVRMTTMKWNKDLADYAGLNVRRCRFEHDCHNTPKYKYSGQNIFYHASTGGGAKFENITHFIHQSIIGSWWAERQYASQYNIDNCCKPDESAYQINHFLEMSLAKADEIGCEISEYTSHVGKTMYIVCNYSFTITVDYKTYESGPTGSKCKSGRNPKYLSLCSENEVVDVNDPFNA